MILLSANYAPVAQASHNNNPNVIAAQQNSSPAAETSKTKPNPKAKAVASKPSEISVFDSEVLNSPINYLKKAFASEEEDTDTTSNNSAVVITVKALIATLLSTIM